MAAEKNQIRGGGGWEAVLWEMGTAGDLGWEVAKRYQCPKLSVFQWLP